MNHDYKKLTRAIKAICLRHFQEDDDDISLVELELDEKAGEFDEFMIENPEQIWFSTLNDEVEGYYLEILSINQLRSLLD